MKKGKYYKFIYAGLLHITQYVGREKGFNCCVCGKGENAYCFNSFNTLEQYNNGAYETFSFGKEHLPKLIEVSESELR